MSEYYLIKMPVWFNTLISYGITPHLYWNWEREEWGFNLCTETKRGLVLYEHTLYEHNLGMHRLSWIACTTRRNTDTEYIITCFDDICEAFKTEYRIRGFGSQNWLDMLEDHDKIRVEYKKEYVI